MGVMEKIGEAMKQNEEKKKGFTKSILMLLLEWQNFEKDFDMSTTCLKECFNELDAKEKKLNAVQESVVESSKELDSIRESVEKRREEFEAKDEEFRVYSERELKDLECKWEEFSLAQKRFDEIVKLREEKLNEQEKMVERLWGETEYERKQLEDLGKSVDSKFREISVKQKEFEERSKDFNRIQSWIREETDALLLKERKFKERVEEFEIKDKALQSREKEMETRERSLDSVRKELMAKENCLDNVKEELKVKETELDSVKKELREKEYNLESIQKELREKETTIVSVAMELQGKINNLDLVKKQLRIEEDRLSFVKKELEIKDKSVDTINKKLELREQELISFQERLQLQEGELNSIQNEYRHRLEELDFREKKLDSVSVSMQKCNGELNFEKENFQAEQELLNKRMEDIALKEKQVEMRFREIKQREEHITDLFEVLMEQEKQLKTVCNVPVKTEPIDNVEKNRVCAITGDSTDISFFVTMGGKSLQIYLNEREKVLDSMSDEVFKALQLSPSPGQLVLEAMEGFYPPHLRKGDTEFDGNVTRRSCIFLLKQLIRVSPKNQRIVQVAAWKLAREWKVKLKAAMGNQLEILGFLYLLAAYSIASPFDADELVSLLTVVIEHDKSNDLCRLLGVTEKISCFIQNLIAKQQHVEAVKCAYVFDLVNHFPPIPILKDYIKQVMQISENVCNRETLSTEEKNEAIEQSIASIRAVIRCIEDHELQSQYPSTQLEECIESLTRKKADTTAAVNVISEAQKPQQTQLKQMASTCPSVPTDKKAQSSTSSSEEASTCNLGHSDAFAFIVVGMGGKNLQSFLIDHWAEHELLRSEVTRALRISTDSGMLVLEALGGFYPPEPHKEEIVFNHIIIRKSCILLLEQLMRISPKITPKAKLEASGLASDWKAKMTAEMENHLAILGFLLLVGAYSLASNFDKNVLESLCCTVAQHRNVTQICHALGISDIKRPMSHSNSEPLSDNVERSSKQQNLISICDSSVVHLTSDPAKIVLDALRKCYSAQRERSSNVLTKKRKRGTFIVTPSVMKRFCDLLEQLSKVSAEIRPQVKAEATEFAVEWRATLIGSWEALGFLNFVASFELSSSFDSDDLVGLLEFVPHKKRAINLIKVLGFADKIPCFIEKLIGKGELVVAFTYIYELELVDSFSPVLLLENYVRHSTEQAQKMRNGRRKVQKKVKAAVECIEQHSLQSGYLPDELRARILEIESLMEKPNKSLCAPNPRATVSSGGCTSVIPNSSHLTQHYVPDPRVPLSNFRGPTLHPRPFLHHNSSYDMTETQTVPTQGDPLQGDPTQSPARTTPSGSTQPPSDPSSSTGPSVQQEIMYYDPRSPYYIGEPGTWEEGRLIIYPEGDNSFCPNTDATPILTRCMRSQWKESWPSWGAVPPQVKQRIMQAFEAECKWHPALDYKVRSNFPKKCGELFKNAMYVARKKGKMPGFLYDHQWRELQQYWKTPEFLKKSEQGKKARASSKGGSLHTGGSVSAATQKMRLENKENRTIPIPEMHKIRHIKSGKKGGEVWVEPRAKEAWEKATKAVEEWTSTQQSECGRSTPAPLTLEQETNLWLEVNGGVKKGSAYGLATLYSSGKHKSNYLGSCATAPSSSADPGEMTRVKEETAELKRQNEAMRLANEAHQREMHEMMQKLLKRQKKSKGKRKSRRRHSSSSEYDTESSSDSSQ